MGASIAIVGAGPRGISITERIAAFVNERGGQPLTLHIIDDAQLGAGRIWDTAQTRTLCMNTLAGAVTLFTEPGATVTAPVFEGPTMFEWVQALRGEESHPLIDALTTSLREAGRVRPFAPGGVKTASPETDDHTRRTVHPDGELDARLHIVGIPTGKQWADTTISPMPGTDPLMLQETDKTARSLLTQAGVL